MADSDKKPVLNLVPAILTGTAALLAALTTVYVNVRNDIKGVAAVPVVSAPAVVPVKPAAPVSLRLRLQLQRIAVHQDGAVGNADWRFAVEADGEPLFTLEQQAMSAQGGRNVLVVDEQRQAYASLQMEPARPVSIVVKGWRDGWLGSTSEPLVFGEGTLSAPGSMGPITVQAEDPQDGEFTFYFSAAPLRD